VVRVLENSVIYTLLTESVTSREHVDVRVQYTGYMSNGNDDYSLMKENQVCVEP
jgi:hypothetical protein